MQIPAPIQQLGSWCAGLNNIDAIHQLKEGTYYFNTDPTPLVKVKQYAEEICKIGLKWGTIIGFADNIFKNIWRVEEPEPYTLRHGINTLGSYPYQAVSYIGEDIKSDITNAVKQSVSQYVKKDIVQNLTKFVTQDATQCMAHDFRQDLSKFVTQDAPQCMAEDFRTIRSFHHQNFEDSSINFSTTTIACATLFAAFVLWQSKDKIIEKVYEYLPSTSNIMLASHVALSALDCYADGRLAHLTPALSSLLTAKSVILSEENYLSTSNIANLALTIFIIIN